VTTTIACSLDQHDLAERRERWRALAASAELEIASTPSGLRLFFRDRPGLASELRELVELERDCCRFADWSVERAVFLDVSGTGDEAIAAVQGMFRDLRSDDPGAAIPVRLDPAAREPAQLDV
jgi:hypothetical protein